MFYEEVVLQIGSLPLSEQRRLAAYLADKLSDEELKQLGVLACSEPIPSTYCAYEAEALALKLLAETEAAT